MTKIITFVIGLILGALIAMSAHAAHAADTGWLSGTYTYDNTQCAAGNIWTQLSYAGASDNQYAVSSIGVLKRADACLVGTFSPSLPAGATIDGIEVQMERSRTGTLGTVSDGHVQLFVNGTIGGNNKAQAGAWTTTDTTRTYGSASDLWGTSYNGTQTIGVGVNQQYGGTTGSAGVNIDLLQMKIYYTENKTQTSFDPKWLFAILPAYASTTCDFITDSTSGGHHVTTTAECSDPITDNPAQNLYNGIILFFITAGSIIAVALYRFNERG